MMFADDLLALGACNDAVEWVGKRTLAQAWSECREPQWMLWLLRKINVDTRRCGGLFALRVWHLAYDDAKLACAWAIDCALRGADGDERGMASSAAYGYQTVVSDAAAFSVCTNHTDIVAECAVDAATNPADERRAQCAIIREEIPLATVRAALNRRMKR